MLWTINLWVLANAWGSIPPLPPVDSECIEALSPVVYEWVKFESRPHHSKVHTLEHPSQYSVTSNHAWVAHPKRYSVEWVRHDGVRIEKEVREREPITVYARPHLSGFLEDSTYYAYQMAPYIQRGSPKNKRILNKVYAPKFGVLEPTVFDTRDKISQINLHLKSHLDAPKRKSDSSPSRARVKYAQFQAFLPQSELLVTNIRETSFIRKGNPKVRSSDTGLVIIRDLRAPGRDGTARNLSFQAIFPPESLDGFDIPYEDRERIVSILPLAEEDVLLILWNTGFYSLHETQNGHWLASGELKALVPPPALGQRIEALDLIDDEFFVQKLQSNSWFKDSKGIWTLPLTSTENEDHPHQYWTLKIQSNPLHPQGPFAFERKDLSLPYPRGTASQRTPRYGRPLKQAVVIPGNYVWVDQTDSVSGPHLIAKDPAGDWWVLLPKNRSLR